MENDVFADKERVALHLNIELVRDLNSARMVGARLGPFTTHFAGLNNVRDEFHASL
jgi:hypothetical protein